jgi:hypothetical protein
LDENTGFPKCLLMPFSCRKSLRTFFGPEVLKQPGEGRLELELALALKLVPQIS